MGRRQNQYESSVSAPLAFALFWAVCAVTVDAQTPQYLSEAFQLTTDTTSQPDVGPAPDSDDDVDSLLNMDLDQLSRADVVVPAMDTVVSTVSRQESTVGRSPAAVFVITAEMIKRSGALTIPDLLRMVPGVQVAQIDANKWAITARGFNNQYANKLLVQIDGQSVYNQAFSGVFWDAEDLVLQDIERIEVIRGPGATVWGANAVNGVINIITKNAKDTQGALISGGTGTEQRGFSTVRYGGQIGEDLSWRVFGKQFERDGGYSTDTQFDDWRQARTGFRADWTPSKCDSLMFKGDLFEGDSGSFLFPTTPYDTRLNGGSALARWTRVIDDRSDWTLKSYYSQRSRHDVFAEYFEETFDIDFHYRFPIGQRHNVIAGGGYRHINDSLAFVSPLSSYIPAERKTDLYSCFVQDEITLVDDRWYLTLGSKFENNVFSGFEYQPSARLLYLPSDRQSVWAAVSRAVRTPNRTEHGIAATIPVDPTVPMYMALNGNTEVEAEDLLAVEFGYRAQPIDEFSWDLALFYNDYENLIIPQALGAPVFDGGLGGLLLPALLVNGASADTYGAELAVTLQLCEELQMRGAYTLLIADIHTASTLYDQPQQGSPNNQLYLQMSWDPRCDLHFDFIGRYVDNLPAYNVSSYFVSDMRVAWRPTRHFEWALVGRNLYDPAHREFTGLTTTTGTLVEEELFTTLTWEY